MNFTKYFSKVDHCGPSELLADSASSAEAALSPHSSFSRSFTPPRVGGRGVEDIGEGDLEDGEEDDEPEEEEGKEEGKENNEEEEE